MTYNHDHPDSDLFNEKTLGDYLARKSPWPCVVIGGEYGLDKSNTDGVSSDCGFNHMDDKFGNDHSA